MALWIEYRKWLNWPNYLHQSVNSTCNKTTLTCQILIYHILKDNILFRSIFIWKFDMLVNKMQIMRVRKSPLQHIEQKLVKSDRILLERAENAQSWHFYLFVYFDKNIPCGFSLESYCGYLLELPLCDSDGYTFFMENCRNLSFNCYYLSQCRDVTFSGGWAENITQWGCKIVYYGANLPG